MGFRLWPKVYTTIKTPKNSLNSEGFSTLPTHLDSFKAVFFDVGGTLLTPHPSVGHIYLEQAIPFGFTGSADDLNFHFRRAWKALGGMESLGQKKGLEVERRYWRDVVKRTFDACGGVDDFENCFENIYDAFRSRDAWRLYEDVVESRLVERLKDKGVVLGIVSNWDSRLKEILDNLEIGHHFDFVLASTVIGSAKPDPLIFEKALQLSGTSPDQTIHIGDEPSTDITGARNLGIDAILIDRKNRYPDCDAKTISSFMELV
ncbi:MAG: HAD-IA family hydrolase [Candidatus Nitronauta litoralis]|uniref:HAD-IA family hydrolase n=1 Tax=Candidatus Nitronauta litoralis TaxID=2705533 RepID=A0A7T0BYH7_9BACT|nr:MAG: HAD-IA family hydrolase [Candidatus Nitronauta litoralis]